MLKLLLMLLLVSHQQLKAQLKAWASASATIVSPVGVEDDRNSKLGVRSSESVMILDKKQFTGPKGTKKYEGLQIKVTSFTVIGSAYVFDVSIIKQPSLLRLKENSATMKVDSFAITPRKRKSVNRDKQFDIAAVFSMEASQTDGRYLADNELEVSINFN